MHNRAGKKGDSISLQDLQRNRQNHTNKMSSGIEWKSKSVLIAAIIAFVVLYLLWHNRQSIDIGSSSKSDSFTQFHTWKTKAFVDVPPDMLQKAEEIKIDERRVSFPYDGEQKTLFFLQVIPTSRKSVIPLVLLHGAGDSSHIWENKIGTIKFAASMGYEVIAVDLPGYGKSPAGKTKNAGDFLNEFLRSQKIERPIIVAPSMAGSYALPYLMGKDPGGCTKRVRGFIPMAPVGTQSYTDAMFYRCEAPTMIVFGSKDIKLGLLSLNHLRNMPNSEIMEMENLGHACYIEDPAQWHRLLYNYLLAVEREQD